jgi:hypothetical protein
MDKEEGNRQRGPTNPRPHIMPSRQWIGRDHFTGNYGRSKQTFKPEWFVTLYGRQAVCFAAWASQGASARRDFLFARVIADQLTIALPAVLVDFVG